MQLKSRWRRRQVYRCFISRFVSSEEFHVELPQNIGVRMTKHSAQAARDTSKG